MLKIVAISDTHNYRPEAWANTIPDGDVLIHAGDATSQGSLPEIKKFLEWFSKQPHKHKLLIAGNHDWMYERDPELAQLLLSEYPGITYLQDSSVEIEGVKFYGSPWQPEFCNWAFNLPRGEALKQKWDLIPNDTDVLITHGPPYGYGDWVAMNYPYLQSYNSPRVGCEELIKALTRVKPKVHVWGHIHCAYGRYTIAYENGTETQGVNASICDEEYHPENAPIIVEV